MHQAFHSGVVQGEGRSIGELLQVAGGMNKKEVKLMKKDRKFVGRMMVMCIFGVLLSWGILRNYTPTPENITNGVGIIFVVVGSYFFGKYAYMDDKLFYYKYKKPMMDYFWSWSRMKELWKDKEGW